MHLDEYLKANDLTEVAFAELIGSSQPTVHRLRKGGQIPSRSLMRAIFAATGGTVTANDFFGLPVQSGHAA